MPVDPLNVEFVRLLAASGWSQAESARQLELTPATISLYVSNQTRPSLTTIKLFKLMIGDRAPIPGEERFSTELHDKARPLEEWEQDLLKDLRSLEEETRHKAVQHFRALAGLMNRQGKKKKAGY